MKVQATCSERSTGTPARRRAARSAGRRAPGGSECARGRPGADPSDRHDEGPPLGEVAGGVDDHQPARRPVGRSRVDLGPGRPALACPGVGDDELGAFGQRRRRAGDRRQALWREDPAVGHPGKLDEDRLSRAEAVGAVLVGQVHAHALGVDGRDRRAQVHPAARRRARVAHGLRRVVRERQEAGGTRRPDAAARGAGPGREDERSEQDARHGQDATGHPANLPPGRQRRQGRRFAARPRCDGRHGPPRV